MPSSDLVQALSRGLLLLQTISNSGTGLRLHELSETLGLNNKTAFNILRTLSHHSFVQKDAHNRYHLGPAVLDLLRNEYRGQTLSQAGMELLRISQQLPGCVVTLVELSDNDLRARLRVSPDRPEILQRPLHLSFSIYHSSTGLCFLAQSRFQQMLLHNFPFSEHGVGQWGSLAAMQSFLQASQERGYVSLRLDANAATSLAAYLGGNYALGIKVMPAQVEEGIRQLLTSVEGIRANNQEL